MPSTAWNKTEFGRQLDLIRSQFDSFWVGKHGFQLHLVEIAWLKLRRRGMGWLSHEGVWNDDAGIGESTSILPPQTSSIFLTLIILSSHNHLTKFYRIQIP